ncbi:MAG: hypothetical protein JNM72_02405 [Deltaproteobacteria bacterium]|nr:hypothetical protein [Deltaproteobacteria bacterium]
MKVTSPDVIGEDSDCGEVDLVGGPWPFDSVYGFGPEGWGYSAEVDADWSLNDPWRTYQLLQMNNISLYLHGTGGGWAVGTLEGEDERCDWLSLAGLNDLIEDYELSIDKTYTGMIVSRMIPARSLGYGVSAEEVGFCAYRDWVARARRGLPSRPPQARHR